MPSLRQVGRFAVATLRVKQFSLGNHHLWQAGFGFFLLSSIVHARLVVEPVETHLPLSHSGRTPSWTMSHSLRFGDASRTQTVGQQLQNQEALMISDFLQVAAAVTLGILSLFGIIELIGWIDAGITAILMSLNARKIGWGFQPGICSLFVTKPFKLTCPDNGGFTISVNRKVKMKYSHSSIRVEMRVNNDIRGGLLVRPRGFFEKKRRYFNNQWDKKLLVQSRPASFGRKIFSSPETLSTIHKLIKGKFPHSYNHIQITPSGKFGILLIDKGFSAQRADVLIWLAKEVASQLKQIKD